MGLLRIVHTADDYYLADELQFELACRGISSTLSTDQEELALQDAASVEQRSRKGKRAAEFRSAPRVKLYSRKSLKSDAMSRLHGLPVFADNVDSGWRELVGGRARNLRLRDYDAVADALRSQIQPGIPLGAALRGEVVVTVHGTADGQEDEAHPRWWETQSEFEAALRRDDQGGYSWLAFKWTGANRESERQWASVRLARLMDELLAHGCRILVITHSHGGNVVRTALCRMKNAKKSSIRVVAVAVPFFRYARWQFSALGHLGAIGGALAFSGLVVGIFAWLCAMMLNYGLLALLLMVPFATIPIWSLSSLWRQIGAVRRDVVRANSKAPVGIWRCISSKNDEAVAFLDFVSETLHRKLRDYAVPDGWISTRGPLPGAFTTVLVASVLSIALLFGAGLRTGEAAFVIVPGDLFTPEMVRPFRPGIVPDYAICDGPRDGSRSVMCFGSDGQDAFVIRRYSGFWLHPASPLNKASFASMSDSIDRSVSMLPSWLLERGRDASLVPVLLILAVFVALWGAPFVRLRGPRGMTRVWDRLGRRVNQIAGSGGAATLALGGIVYSVFEQIVVSGFARGAAYGDDCRAGIVGIETEPWQSMAHTEMIWLEGDEHEDIEAHVCQSYTPTMTKVRAILTPTDGATGVRKWERFFAELSWSELAHTAYFRVDSVVAKISRVCAAEMRGAREEVRDAA